MKGFLLDENLPRRLMFTPSFPVTHATDLGAAPSDTALWEHARRYELVIVTKDADFSDRVMLSTAPPWVVHLRVGNMCLKDFHAFLTRAWPRIEALLPANKLLNVHPDRIEAIQD